MKAVKQLRAENNTLRTKIRRYKTKCEVWRFNFFFLLAFLILIIVAQTFGIGVLR
jgi:hypothetical protein